MKRGSAGVGVTEIDAQLGSLDALTPMALVDSDLVVIRTNEAFICLVGRKTSFNGQPLVDLLSACADLEQVEGRSYFAFGGEAARQWLRLDLQPRTGGSLASLVDVSAERRAFEALRRSYLTRDQLLHDAQVGTWRFNPDEKLYYFSNELSLGHTQSQAVSTETLAKVQHPEDTAKDIAIRDRITSEGGTAQTEMRYRDAEGSWTHLNVRYRAGRRLPSGLYEMYGLSQSVTRLAQVRDEATANAHRLRMALEAARAAVFEYDYGGETLWLSPEFGTLTGLTSESQVEQIFSAYHKEDRAAVVALSQHSGEGPRPDPIDVRLLAPDGERWVRLYYEVERSSDGGRLRGVGLMLDIDEQKRQALALNEARRVAEAATEAKSTFLASVSHEIRTPMNGIVGVLNLLRRESLSTEGAELLDEALACGDMLSQLINDVLDFSKMEAGKLDLSPLPTDPIAVAASVMNLIRPQAQAKGIYLRVIAPDDMGHIDVDPVRLRQCLFNVVGNAIKFTAQGGVEVRFSYVGAGEARKLRCEVQDTGVGVPLEAQGRLFGRFQQADSGTTRKFGGTGLGLAISRSLTRMMGGDLDFESRDGEGSTFWFEVTAPPAQAPQTIVGGQFDGVPLEGLLILVVDDNATNRLIGVKSLQALGAEAEAVDSGSAAIDAVQAKAYDLVLMDINMPQMDGMEATRRIRALASPAAQVPVIALTADVMSDQQQRYYDAGMNGVVPKPFSPAQLIAGIAQLMQDDDAPLDRALGA